MLLKIFHLIFLRVVFILAKHHYAPYHPFHRDDHYGGYFVEKQSRWSPRDIFKDRTENGLNFFNNFIQQQFGQQSPVRPPPICGSRPGFCERSKYRSFDGSCNNLKYPVLGTPNTTYNRLLPAYYADGQSTPAVAKSGNQLPLARSISLVIYPDIPIQDPVFNLNAMIYGQIITHDMSMMAGNSQTQHDQRKCCSAQGQLLQFANIPEHCFPIVLPDDDPFHSRIGTKCMSFSRTITNVDRGCVRSPQPAEQLTAVTHFLDLSLVYGNDREENRQLRQFREGRLRVDIRKGMQWPPRALNASGTCRLRNPNDACYLAGDPRVNQNPQLTLLQVVLLREHNRIADELANINPHWNDELLFQEARKINIAQHQYISYYEWLPYFIGWQNSLKNRLVWKTDGYVDDYDEEIVPSVLNEHANGAFRHFHSLIFGRLHLISENRNSVGSVRLSDHLNRPEILEKANKFDELSRGLTTQPQSASDQFHDSEITQFLFRQDNETFGIDLQAFSIQRNRDHGIATYNAYREFWGSQRAQTFRDFLDLINENNVLKLAALYESPEDVDLIVGGSLETNVPGALAGPTFLRIITEQFYRTRAGDRFWFERSGETGFTLEQLREIRKTSISRLLCDNGNKIRAMQPRGFERISASNPVVSCESLPSVNLLLWRDPENIEDQLQRNDFFLAK